MHDMATNKPRRPVLRYHGGKWQMGQWIISHFPAHRAYVEPYGGAASVLLQKDRSFVEVYNDLDDEIVNLFRVMRDPESVKRLVHLLELTPWARTEFYHSYEPAADPVERARRTITRSYMAFGTTSRRVNRTGFRGTAIRRNYTGVEDWVNYPSNLANVAERFRGVVIEHRPAIGVIKAQDHRDTLFYLDPPYVPSTRHRRDLLSRNDRCYAHEMDDNDHRQLADVLNGIKGMAVVSGYASDLYDSELYGNWARFEKKHKAMNHTLTTEVLWVNAAAMRGGANTVPSG